MVLLFRGKVLFLQLLFQFYQQLMNLWWILYVVDWLLFTFVALTVVYVLVYSIASLFSHRAQVAHSKHTNRFIVLITSYGENTSVLQTVTTVLGQNFPQRMFDVVVVSDHQNELVNMRLAQFPITLLTPNFDVSSKAKSLQYAVLNLPQFKLYDVVVVLDSGNVVKPEFLQQLNDAFESAGTKAIQTHRIAKNRDTAAARLDAIFEEINNSIFRKGHLAIGLSAALNGSGIAFDFQWFKRSIMQVRPSVGEDKELEAMLVKEGIFIDYFDDIHVYDEKTRRTEDFNRQRGRWVHTQLHALLSNLRFLPSSLANHRYDQADKIVQWMLFPRTILIAVISIMGVVLPFIYLSIAIKWWVAGALALLAFSVATPDYLVDENWDRDFLRVPIVTFGAVLNIFRAGKDEVSERFSGVGLLVNKMAHQKKRKSRKKR